MKLTIPRSPFDEGGLDSAIALNLVPAFPQFELEWLYTRPSAIF